MPGGVGRLSTVRLRAMASDVTLSVAGPRPLADAALERAGEVFARVGAACTRFDPRSPLMRANADPRQWHHVPRECFDAVAEAWGAHRDTGGLFDPRVLRALVRLGYDRTLPFRSGPVVVTTPGGSGRPEHIPLRPMTAPPAPPPWRPDLDSERSAVRLGEHPIDLGGIGKGLAVRWAAEELAATAASYLVEAGGDCAVGGDGPDGGGWLIGVEDPSSTAPQPELVAALRLADAACATSSVRVRSWTADGRPVHHLIDPRTGDSARAGLRAVTVVADDAARAEVWSKGLFLAGRTGIAAICAQRHLAALWVGEDGSIGMSEAMRPLVIWEATGAV